MSTDPNSDAENPTETPTSPLTMDDPRMQSILPQITTFVKKVTAQHVGSMDLPSLVKDELVSLLGPTIAAGLGDAGQLVAKLIESVLAHHKEEQAEKATAKAAAAAGTPATVQVTIDPRSEQIISHNDLQKEKTRHALWWAVPLASAASVIGFLLGLVIH